MKPSGRQTTDLYTVSTMHCMAVSLAFDGAGLGTVWGRQLATSMQAQAGFATSRSGKWNPTDQLLLHRAEVTADRSDPQLRQCSDR